LQATTKQLGAPQPASTASTQPPLEDALDEAEARTDVNALIFAGQGKFFCASVVKRVCFCCPAIS
jgi:enoyl-CoA hydratase/carnithine racemase